MKRQKLYSFLKFIDLFGEPVKVNINKNEAITTVFGGILSIITFVVITIFSWFIGKDIYYKQNPFSYSQNELFHKYQDVKMNNTNFPFSVGIFDFTNTPVYDSRYYNLQVEIGIGQMDQNGSLKTQFYRVEMIKCNYSHFPTLTKEDFDNAYLYNTFCPVNQTIILKGFWSESYLAFLGISVAMCNYEKDSTCKSESEIRNYISKNGINLNIYHLESAVILKNFTNPLTTVIKNIYKYFDTDKYKVIEYMVETDKVITDVGFLLSEEETINFFKMDLFSLDTTNFNYEDKRLMSYYFYSSNKSNIYYRKYIKIADIVASVGGLLKIFPLVFSVINLKFSRINRNEMLINEIFQIRFFNHKDEYTSHTKNLFAIQDLPPESERNCIRHQTTITNNINADNLKLKYEKILKKIKFRNTKKLNLNSIDIFKLLFCQNKNWKDPKFQKTLHIYTTGYKMLDDYFNFVNIIKKFEDFESLKKLLLTKNQLQLFDINRKPSLTVINNFKPDSSRNDNIDQELKMFLEKFITNSQTIIDENILDLILFR